MKLVGVLDLRQNLAKHLDRVAEECEGIIIVQRSKPIARLIPYREEPMSEERAEYTTAAEGGAFHLDDQGDIQPSAQALVQTLLTVHRGDRAAAARALLAHIQAEQAALALLLANEGQP